MSSNKLREVIDGMSPFSKIRHFNLTKFKLHGQYKQGSDLENAGKPWTKDEELVIFKEFKDCPRGAEEVIALELALRLKRKTSAIRIQRDHVFKRYDTFDHSNMLAKCIRETADLL